MWKWFSDELPKFFNQSVLGPLKITPNLFTNDDVLPPKRFVLLFGRPGVGKRTAIETLCEQAQISYSTLDAEHLHQEDGTSKISLTAEHTSVQVLIVEHANSLLVGPYATAWTRDFALDLKTIAYANKIFIFCLCDIVPKHLTQGDRDLLAVQYLQNFDATIYFKAPTATYREEMFRRRFALFFDHVPHITDNLTADDYKMLTDASHHCTPLQITRFVQRVSLAAVSSPPQGCDAPLALTLVLGTDFLKQCMFSSGPVDYSITEENATRAESTFAADAGQSIPSGRAAETHQAKQEALAQQVDSFVAEPIELEEEEEREDPSAKRQKNE